LVIFANVELQFLISSVYFQFKMPEEYKSSWADEVELDSGSLPPPTESTDGHGNKTVTEYKLNKDDKKVKVVRMYKVTKHVVSKSVARRKELPKFGDSAKDADGPNPHTTFVSEDIMMQLITSKEEEKSNDTVLDPKSEFMSHVERGELPLIAESFQINSPSVVSATAVTSRPLVLIATQLRTSRRFSTPSRSPRPQPRLRPRSQENTFLPSSRTNRRTLAERDATTPRPFAFPISPSRRPTPISRTSRTNLAKNRRCIWRRTRTPDSAKVSLTFISTTRKMPRLQLKLSMDMDTIT
jgi:hypothetical protein